MFPEPYPYAIPHDNPDRHRTALGHTHLTACTTDAPRAQTYQHGTWLGGITKGCLGRNDVRSGGEPDNSTERMGLFLA